MARHYPGVVRAQQDLKDGSLWKARDRLHGVLRSAPADQETLELLGSVYYEMGDLPNAGRYWFLTDRNDSQTEEAQAALHDRYPFPELLRHIPARAPAEDYPPQVQVRIEELKTRADRGGAGWKPGQGTHIPPPKTAGANLGDVVMIAIFLILGPGLWLLGIGAAIWLIVP